MDRKSARAAVAALRKERQAIAWDANCALLFETGNAYQERCLLKYRQLTTQIEAIESEFGLKPASGADPPAAARPGDLNGQTAFAFGRESDYNDG